MKTKEQIYIIVFKGFHVSDYLTDYLSDKKKELIVKCAELNNARDETTKMNRYRYEILNLKDAICEFEERVGDYINECYRDEY